MKIARALMALILSVLLTGLVSGLAIANVPGVALNAPPPPPAPNVATAGSSAMIKVVTTHRDTGSPALHYVDRVALYDGDKLLKEWKYDQNNYKKDETWTESYSGTVNSDMHLRAVAHCTVHGYDLAGVLLRVMPAGTKPSDMMKTDAGSMGMQAFGYSDASKATDYLSSAGSKFMGSIVKAQTNDIKSFQGKFSDWMKSSDGQQFISQRDQQMAQPTTRMMKAAGEMGRQPATATAKVNTSTMPKPTTRVYRSLAIYIAGTENMPRVSAIATPTPIAGGGMKGPNATMKASPTMKRMLAQPMATMKPLPTMKASPTVKPTMKPTTRYMLAQPMATMKPSPTPAPTVKTPAQSYGIFGLGGPVPSPVRATATVRPVPSGSPTPVPGGYTPRYAGEPGYGKATPTPTVMPKISPSPMAKKATPLPKASGTMGMAGTPLNSDSRYSGKGPGVVDHTMVQPPSGAPGPMASPLARPVMR